jgi:hypothetical protein
MCRWQMIQASSARTLQSFAPRVGPRGLMPVPNFAASAQTLGGRTVRPKGGRCGMPRARHARVEVRAVLVCEEEEEEEIVHARGMIPNEIRSVGPTCCRVTPTLTSQPTTTTSLFSMLDPLATKTLETTPFHGMICPIANTLTRPRNSLA